MPRPSWGRTFDAFDPDLSRFRQRGGKLILYHGWNDPSISPLNTINYYERVVSLLQKSGSRPQAEAQAAGIRAALHGARHVALWRRSRPEQLRHAERARELGGTEATGSASADRRFVAFDKRHLVDQAVVRDMPRKVAGAPDVGTDPERPANFVCQVR